jgi:hypothetical protein
MKRSYKIFRVFYIIWSVMNIGMLIMALNDTFGEFDRSTARFWPFSIGSPKSYDYLELAIYLLLPLIVFFSYRLTQYYYEHSNDRAHHTISRKETAEEILEP